jgi:phosphoglycolate phosphatase (TIGR01487 family)
MEMLADLQICERAYQELVKVYPLERISSSRYRFTDVALGRNFDVAEASAYATRLGLEAELIDTTFAVHIKDKKVSKGTGLRRVAERMGLSLAEFGAVGDSNSDLPMFELAGFRASVANATPELKEASDYVADAEYGEGFAQIVKYMEEKGLF